MPIFEVYATGSYTYTKKVEAATKEEAEEIFFSDNPSICYQCGSEGIELEEMSSDATVTEIDPDDED